MGRLRLSLLWFLYLIFLPNFFNEIFAIDTERYLLQKNDILYISIKGDAVASREYTIGIDGKITLSLIGSIKAEGLKVKELEKLLKEEYSRYYVAPLISVSLIKVGPGCIYISGEVEDYGEVQLEDGFSLAKLLFKQKVKEKSADLERIKIFRKEKVIEIDFLKFLKGEDSSGNTLLEKDDIIYIPEKISPQDTSLVSSGRVTVIGAVSNPGEYKIYPNSRLLDILTLANIDYEHADISNVIIVSKNGNKVIINVLKILKGEDVSRNVYLKPWDTIILPAYEETEMKIIIVGAVKRSGTYRLREPEGIRVKEALILSEGYREEADLSNTLVIRNNGLKETIDLKKLLYSGDVTQDIILKPGDTLMIPQKELIEVYVLGKVAKPGLYSRYESMNIFQALSFAEQPTFGAQLAQTRIIRGWPDNPKVIRVNLSKVIGGNLEEDILLENGDVIYVPETVVSDSLEFWARILGSIRGTYKVDSNK
ncbi:MAG: polysaccharide biosynthesis/export family protein [Candidatus Hydrogenedentota bacterium]